MKRNLLALILVFLMLFTLPSCGFIIINDISSENESEQGGTDTSATDKDPEAESGYTKYEDGESKRELARAYLEELPDRYYDGAAFFITTPSTDYISPDETGEAVSKLAHERNREVEEMLGITIVTTVCDANTMLEELKQAEGDTTEEQARLTEEIKNATEAQEYAQRGYEAATKGVEDWQVRLNYAQADLNKLDGHFRNLLHITADHVHVAREQDK